MEITEPIKALCDEIYEKTTIDIEYQLKTTESTNFDELVDELQDANMFYVEIIYYSRAMEYLSENDNSLKESLNIAQDFGYTPDNLNSEILASLLASQNAETDFMSFENKINEVVFGIID